MLKDPMQRARNIKKVANHKGQILEVLEVYTHHLSNCKSSFSHHVLGPNDLHCATRYINGSPIQLLFDSGSSHNFVNDCLVQIWGIQTTVCDHTYMMHLVDGRLQYINGAIHSLAIYINNYEEQVYSYY